MKKQLLSLIVLVVVLCLTACTANQNQVSKPTSPENLGYSISREKISQTVLEDSEFFNQETFYHPDFVEIFLCGGDMGGVCVGGGVWCFFWAGGEYTQKRAASLERRVCVGGECNIFGGGGVLLCRCVGAL